MSLILRDEAWQDMGFKRRPKYGALLERFRPAWRVNLEDSVLREMLILFTVAHIAAGVVGKDQIEDLIRIYVAGPDGNSDLWKTFGYPSRTDAESHFRAAISKYLESGMQDWLQMLPSRLGTLEVPDRKLAGRLTVGAIEFAQNVQNMVLHLRSGLKRRAG
jgi:hypothetical protein